MPEFHYTTTEIILVYSPRPGKKPWFWLIFENWSGGPVDFFRATTKIFQI